MLRMILFSALLCIAPAAVRSGQPVTTVMTYEAFMRVGPSEREKVFAQLTAENRAQLKREHAQRWLKAHRSELSSRQISVVEKAINFVTPAIYSSPGSPELKQREEALKHELTCTLNRQTAVDAFSWTSLNVKPSSPGFDDWFSWFSECVIKDPPAGDARIAGSTD